MKVFDSPETGYLKLASKQDSVHIIKQTLTLPKWDTSLLQVSSQPLLPTRKVESALARKKITNWWGMGTKLVPCGSKAEILKVATTKLPKLKFNKIRKAAPIP